MNNPMQLEYVTSFAEANQAMMQQLATALLTSGDFGSDFLRFAEVAAVQQNYLAEMGGLWMETLMGPGSAQQHAKKSDRRFASDEWKRSPYHNFSDRSSDRGFRRSHTRTYLKIIGCCRCAIKVE
jgi:hypothetical protein